MSSNKKCSKKCSNPSSSKNKDKYNCAGCKNKREIDSTGRCKSCGFNIRYHTAKNLMKKK